NSCVYTLSLHDALPIYDVHEGWVFAAEEAEVVATDTAVGEFAVGVGRGPFVVKAEDVAVVVECLAEVADGKVDGGFDEFLGEAGHWGDRIVTEITKSCRCRSRRSSVGLTERSGQDRKSTRLNSSHVKISYAVFC